METTDKEKALPTIKRQTPPQSAPKASLPSAQQPAEINKNTSSQDALEENKHASLRYETTFAEERLQSDARIKKLKDKELSRLYSDALNSFVVNPDTYIPNLQSLVRTLEDKKLTSICGEQALAAQQIMLGRALIISMGQDRNKYSEELKGINSQLQESTRKTRINKITILAEVLSIFNQADKARQKGILNLYEQHLLYRGIANVYGNYAQILLTAKTKKNEKRVKPYSQQYAELARDYYVRSLDLYPQTWEEQHLQIIKEAVNHVPRSLYNLEFFKLTETADSKSQDAKKKQTPLDNTYKLSSNYESFMADSIDSLFVMQRAGVPEVGALCHLARNNADFTTQLKCYLQAYCLIFPRDKMQIFMEERRQHAMIKIYLCSRLLGRSSDINNISACLSAVAFPFMPENNQNQLTEAKIIDFAFKILAEFENKLDNLNSFEKFFFYQTLCLAHVSRYQIERTKKSAHLAQVNFIKANNLIPRDCAWQFELAIATSILIPRELRFEEFTEIIMRAADTVHLRQVYPSANNETMSAWKKSRFLFTPEELEKLSAYAFLFPRYCESIDNNELKKLSTPDFLLPELNKIKVPKKKALQSDTKAIPASVQQSAEENISASQQNDKLPDDKLVGGKYVPLIYENTYNQDKAESNDRPNKMLMGEKLKKLYSEVYGSKLGMPERYMPNLLLLVKTFEDKGGRLTLIEEQLLAGQRMMLSGMLIHLSRDRKKFKQDLNAINNQLRELSGKSNITDIVILEIALDILVKVDKARRKGILNLYEQQLLYQNLANVYGCYAQILSTKKDMNNNELYAKLARNNYIKSLILLPSTAAGPLIKDALSHVPKSLYTAEFVQLTKATESKLKVQPAEKDPDNKLNSVVGESFMEQAIRSALLQQRCGLPEVNVLCRMGRNANIIDKSTNAIDMSVPLKCYLRAYCLINPRDKMVISMEERRQHAMIKMHLCLHLLLHVPKLENLVACLLETKFPFIKFSNKDKISIEKIIDFSFIVLEKLKGNEENLNLYEKFFFYRILALSYLNRAKIEVDGAIKKNMDSTQFYLMKAIKLLPENIAWQFELASFALHFIPAKYRFPKLFGLISEITDRKRIKKAYPSDNSSSIEAFEKSIYPFTPEELKKLSGHALLFPQYCRTLTNDVELEKLKKLTSLKPVPLSKKQEKKKSARERLQKEIEILSALTTEIDSDKKKPADFQHIDAPKPVSPVISKEEHEEVVESKETKPLEDKKHTPYPDAKTVKADKEPVEPEKKPIESEKEFNEPEEEFVEPEKEADEPEKELVKPREEPIEPELEVKSKSSLSNFSGNEVHYQQFPTAEFLPSAPNPQQIAIDRDKLSIPFISDMIESLQEELDNLKAPFKENNMDNLIWGSFAFMVYFNFVTGQTFAAKNINLLTTPYNGADQLEELIKTMEGRQFEQRDSKEFHIRFVKKTKNDLVIDMLAVSSAYNFSFNPFLLMGVSMYMEIREKKLSFIFGKKAQELMNFWIGVKKFPVMIPDDKAQKMPHLVSRLASYRIQCQDLLQVIFVDAAGRELTDSAIKAFLEKSCTESLEMEKMIAAKTFANSLSSDLVGYFCKNCIAAGNWKVKDEILNAAAANMAKILQRYFTNKPKEADKFSQALEFFSNRHPKSLADENLFGKLGEQLAIFLDPAKGFSYSQGSPIVFMPGRSDPGRLASPQATGPATENSLKNDHGTLSKP